MDILRPNCRPCFVSDVSRQASLSQSAPGSMPLPSMGQTKREKDGETFHGVTLAAERIERLCKGPNHGAGNDDEPQEKRRAPGDDSDHGPF